jgi:hypothetical protein
MLYVLISNTCICLYVKNDICMEFMSVIISLQYKFVNKRFDYSVIIAISKYTV